MDDKRAKIDVGSWSKLPEASPLYIREKLFLVSPGHQEIWEHYQLVVDGELVTSMHYLLYNPFNDSTEWKYENSGFHVANEIVQRGLSVEDFEVINGQKIDLGYLFDTGMIKLNEEVRVEDFKVEALERSLRNRIEEVLVV